MKNSYKLGSLHNTFLKKYPGSTSGRGRLGLNRQNCLKDKVSFHKSFFNPKSTSGAFYKGGLTS